MMKKDFIFIADVLASVNPIAADRLTVTASEEWEATVHYFAIELGRNFPRFDKAKFYAACGLFEKVSNETL